MNVGIWKRVSTDDQAKGESPKIHEERARMYAKLKGWTVVEVYDLSGVSGKTILEHPEAKRMLADIKAGKIKALIFSKLARLGRNIRELWDIADYFQRHNASLVSLGESIDTTTPAGRLLFSVLAALAQWEREEISARVAASVPIRAKLGRPTGGVGPLGYHWVDKKLIPNSNESPVIQRAYELFLQKRKLLTTCQALNAEGLRARKAKWRPITLKRILTDTIYRGLRRANYSKSKGNKKSWKLKPQNEWVYHDVIPIVSVEVWNEVNGIIQGWQSKYSKSLPKESSYPYGGILECECGKKMYVYAYKGMKINRYVCKSCKNKINENVINNQLLECLKQMVVYPDQLEQVHPEEKTEEVQDKKARLRLLQNELQSVNGKIDKIIDLWSQQSIDRETFETRFSGLKERKDQLIFEIPRLSAEIEFINACEIGKNRLLERAQSIASMWPKLNDDEKRRIIRELLASIIVRKENLTFNLYYLPEFSLLEKGTQILRDSSRRPSSGRQDT